MVTVDPPLKPKNATDVIKVATQVQADGMTASACALWPYYEQKKKVKFFVVVTDEIENIKFQNRHYFPDLFQKYYEEVFPAKLIFVSFLENPNNKGRMVKALENMGFDMLQFRLDGNRPDLTKLDTLLVRPFLAPRSSYSARVSCPLSQPTSPSRSLSWLPCSRRRADLSSWWIASFTHPSARRRLSQSLR